MAHVLAAMPFSPVHRKYLEGIGKNCEFLYTSIEEASNTRMISGRSILGKPMNSWLFPFHICIEKKNGVVPQG